MRAPLIAVSGLSKKYQVYDRPIDRLKEALSRGRRAYHRDFWALRELSFDVPRGQTVGVIGPNGSGKSTLLQLVAGTLRPTTGQVQVNGRLAALLELGAGFNPEFTGRENVFMNGTLIGMRREAVAARFPDIERFAEIGEFMDRPVKTYSSGMFVRLAFATAIHVDPDVLLVDEALSVGDALFAHRCMDRISQLRRSGVSILFVSHDITAIRKLCDRVILLDGGQVVEQGAAEPVINRYLSLIAERQARYAAPEAAHDPGEVSPPSMDLAPAPPVRNVDRRIGTGKAQIAGFGILDGAGAPVAAIEAGKPFHLRITACAQGEVRKPIIGYRILDGHGVEISAGNTEQEGVALPALVGGDVITVDFRVEPPLLAPGHYALTPAIGDGTQDAYELCDSLVNAGHLEIGSNVLIMGVCRMPSDVRYALAVT
ncbi:MAG: ABC transporter ATP-binding protein [Candidatus Sericytochromatia bacterium]|nr:ABC transporter ATP-binding protein [Candidatus Tanganyikabacteria bacterium]